MRRRQGFTLIEILVVVAMISLLATIALPIFVRSKMAASEQSALATMRMVAQAEAHFTTAVAADLNDNGVGEYGVFAELSGKLPVRSTSGGLASLDPALVGGRFRNISPLGEMSIGGYLFRLHLPGAGGNGLPELPGGGADPLTDPSQAETLWCAYAWPRIHGSTGSRTFFVNQSGEILYADDSAYSGSGAPIPAGAAFLPGGPVGSIDGAPAVNAAGRDGNVWRPTGG